MRAHRISSLPKATPVSPITSSLCDTQIPWDCKVEEGPLRQHIPAFPEGNEAHPISSQLFGAAPSRRGTSPCVGPDPKPTNCLSFHVFPPCFQF